MGLEVDTLCTADMAKIIIFSLFVNFPTLMANTIDIGGLLNQAGGANGGLDVGSILNNIDIGSIVDQANGGGDVDISGILDKVIHGQDQGDLNLETLLDMIPKDDNGKVKAEGLKELEKYGITLGKILEMAGLGNNPQVVDIVEQFIADPNSLDEGSKAMVCEAVEVFQEENPKVESTFASLGMDTSTLRDNPSDREPIHVSSSVGIKLASIFKFMLIVIFVKGL